MGQFHDSRCVNWKSRFYSSSYRNFRPHTIYQWVYFLGSHCTTLKWPLCSSEQTSQAREDKRATHLSCRVYSVFSGEICPVTGCLNDVILRLWLQETERRREDSTRGQSEIEIHIINHCPAPSMFFLFLYLAADWSYTQRKLPMMPQSIVGRNLWWLYSQVRKHSSFSLTQYVELSTLRQPAHQALLISIRWGHSLL